MYRLRKEISNHISGRTIGDVDDASVYEIVGPEVTDADVPGQLGVGSSIVDEFNGTHIVLVDSHRGVRVSLSSK